MVAPFKRHNDRNGKADDGIDYLGAVPGLRRNGDWEGAKRDPPTSSS